MAALVVDLVLGKLQEGDTPLDWARTAGSQECVLELERPQLQTPVTFRPFANTSSC